MQTGTTPILKIVVEAQREVAYESPDHLTPWGTKQDNHTNLRFNDKLYKLFPEIAQLTVLDMGCSGGGFVRSCLDQGCLAIGLEGSDYSKQYRRAEWRTIPEYLFTCDVTGDFEISIERKGSPGKRAQFDVVTCWEMMEHIATPDIERVAGNVKKHLAPGGLWIMSVSPWDDIVRGVQLHQTVQPRSWWINKFAGLGLYHFEEYVTYFNTQFVRGPKYGANSFHLVLSPDKTRLPPIPPEPLIRRLHDRWIGCKAQRILAGTYF